MFFADMACLYNFTDHLHYSPTCSTFPGGVMWLECPVEVPVEAVLDGHDILYGQVNDTASV